MKSKGTKYFLNGVCRHEHQCIAHSWQHYFLNGVCRHEQGTWICNQCGAGDGFELIVKARGYSHAEVLKEVGSILGLSSDSNVTDADRQKWREREEKLRLQAEAEERKSQEAAAKRPAASARDPVPCSRPAIFSENR